MCNARMEHLGNTASSGRIQLELVVCEIMNDIFFHFFCGVKQVLPYEYHYQVFHVQFGAQLFGISIFEELKSLEHIIIIITLDYHSIRRITQK